MLPDVHLALGARHLIVSTHGLLVLLGIVAGTVVALRSRRVRPDVALFAVAVVTGVGLFGAQTLYVLQRGGPWGVRGAGMASFGGIGAALAVLPPLARLAGVSPRSLCDAIGPAFLVALGCGRVGCFLNGCCAGVPTTCPWGVVVPMLGPAPRHPLPLYSAAFDFWLAWWSARGVTVPGRAAVRCAVGLGLGRAVLEVGRDPTATDVLIAGVTTPQVLGILLAGGAWAIGRRPVRLRLPLLGSCSRLASDNRPT